MVRQRASAAQRVGMFLAFVEACLFVFVAALHFGFVVHAGGATFAAAFLCPAGILEALLAVALILSLAIPGGGPASAARVMSAQILVVLGVFVGQIALLRGTVLATARSEIF